MSDLEDTCGPSQNFLGGWIISGPYWEFHHSSNTIHLFQKCILYTGTILASWIYIYFLFYFFYYGPPMKETVFIPLWSKISRVILKYRVFYIAIYAIRQLFSIFKDDSDEFLQRISLRWLHAGKPFALFQPGVYLLSCDMKMAWPVELTSL